MASAPDTANNFITYRKNTFNTYNNSRAVLIDKIYSYYTGNTSEALLIKGTNGIEWWIIFVTDSTLISSPTSPYLPYDITIKGNGIHFVYNNGSYACGLTALEWKNNCTPSATTSPANLLDGLKRIEFYGKEARTNHKMTINNVIQKNTVAKADDIVDIEVIAKGNVIIDPENPAYLDEFDYLCEEMATNGNFMKML